MEIDKNNNQSTIISNENKAQTNANDISVLVNQLMQISPHIANSCCIVNGMVMSLAEVESMGYNEFSIRSKINMPIKLYKYFSNREEKENGVLVNYSLQALKNNTVFMQSPSEFDDVYDSEINISFEDYQKYRITDYCKRCNLSLDENEPLGNIRTTFVKKIWESINQYQDYNHIFIKTPENVYEEKSNTIFVKRLQIELSTNADIGCAVAKIIADEYREYIKELKEKFRIACFATSPLSQLMWGGAYADCHKGFCIEYTVQPDDKQYEEIFYNLYPMIYCKKRPSVAQSLVKSIDKEITKDDLWNIYFNGVLRKSIDWAYQNEWRLLIPFSNSHKKDDYNVKFFPITGVYLGNRMLANARKEIIEYCNSKQIPYYGVRRNNDIFEMQVCEVKCEECDSYKNSLG